MTEAYDVPMAAGANCVVVVGRRGGEERVAACVVRADTRADVNNLVKRTLDVRKASFLSMDRAVEETGMEYGGITPVGLPDGLAGARRPGVPGDRRRGDRERGTALEAARPRAAARRAAGRRGRGGSGALDRSVSLALAASREARTPRRRRRAPRRPAAPRPLARVGRLPDGSRRGRTCLTRPRRPAYRVRRAAGPAALRRARRPPARVGLSAAVGCPAVVAAARPLDALAGPTSRLPHAAARTRFGAICRFSRGGGPADHSEPARDAVSRRRRRGRGGRRARRGRGRRGPGPRGCGGRAGRRRRGRPRG